VQKNRLVLIIENLISNAIKYQDSEEATPHLNIRSWNDDAVFIFEVEDNGLGIPEEHREHLFAMFKRFHPKVSFGSGLGLYMMKKSADILGADLVCETPEKGTVFRLSIPLK
jgi:signal transduction histidine kinase